MALLTDSPEPAAPAQSGRRPPAVLLISIAGATALLALGATWLWATRGASILIDIGQLFCL